ncbi:MAG: DUF3108 domain-containing protein [Candidatus Binatia bacterium]
MHRLLAAVVLALAAPALAVSPGAQLEYAVRYGPLQVLEVRTTAQLHEGDYEATSEMRTVGVVALLFPWVSTARAAGRRGADGLRPQSFRNAGDYRGAQRMAEIEYSDSGEIASRIAPPPAADDREAVPAALQRATIDPLTASLAIVHAGCRGTLRIFDGRRRYDLQLADMGEAAPPASPYTSYTGVARHCRATIAPIAGFWRSSAAQDERPSQLDFWVAAPQPGLMAVPVYLELSAPRGSLAIHLTAAQPLPAGS